LAANSNTQFHWFARQLRPLLAHICSSVFLLVLSSLMFLLDPLLLKWLIDRILPKKDFHLLFIAAAGFFRNLHLPARIFSARWPAKFSNGQDLVFRIRLSILEQINPPFRGLPRKNIRWGKTGTAWNRDVDQVSELGSSLVPYAFQTIFNAIFVVGTMLLLDSRSPAWFSRSCPCSFCSKDISIDGCKTRRNQHNENRARKVVFSRNT